MSKFKVGQRIRIKYRKEMPRWFTSNEMSLGKKYSNTIHTIRRIREVTKIGNHICETYQLHGGAIVYDIEIELSNPLGGMYEDY